MNSPSCRLNNGVDLPALGLGVYQSSPEETLAAVRTALEGGYRMIDTAAVYMNEEAVGEGIRASGIPRDEILVQTKLWISDYGHDRTRLAFDRSMKRLGLETLDLYLLHWPVPTQFEHTIASWEAAARLMLEGRVRAIGVCNFSPADLDLLIRASGIIPAVNQVELHPFFARTELQKAHHRHGILTQAWSPIGGVKRYRGQGLPGDDPLQDGVITALAGKYGKTPAQIVLRWHIESGRSVIPKSVHAERIRENSAIFDFSLTREDRAAIDALDRDERGGPDPAEVTPGRSGLRIVK